jgi:hypothetical protein
MSAQRLPPRVKLPLQALLRRLGQTHRNTHAPLPLPLHRRQRRLLALVVHLDARVRRRAGRELHGREVRQRVVERRRGQEPRELEHQRRRDGAAPGLEHALAQRRGHDGGVRRHGVLALAARAPLLLAPRLPPPPRGVLLRVQRIPPRGDDLPFPHEVRDDVHPLLVPAQDARPHLVRLVRLELALERAGDGAEREAEERAPAAVVARGAAALVLDARGEERADQVGAGDVYVGEVGRVCFWVVLGWW